MEKAEEKTSGWREQRATLYEAGKERQGMSEMSEVSSLTGLPVFETAGLTDLSQKGNFKKDVG